MAVPHEAIRQAKVRLREVVERDVNLKREGSRWKGLCPFHDEKTPSFYVVDKGEESFFKCFGCSVGGDAITYVQKRTGKPFSEAVESLVGAISETGEVPAMGRKHGKKPQEPSFSVLPSEDLPLSSCDTVFDNPLTARIAELFGATITTKVLNDYRIAIHPDSISYPEIDERQRFRTGKRIYITPTGGRTDEFKWLHPKGFSLQQCLTGLHRIDRKKIVGIVEGNSTMLFMAALTMFAEQYQVSELSSFQNTVWLCTGGYTNLNLSNPALIAPLKGHRVTLYPDAGFIEKWDEFGEAMNKAGVHANVSRFMEDYFDNGLVKRNEDLRDVFMKHLHGQLKELTAPENIFANWVQIHPEGGEFTPGRRKANDQPETYQVRRMAAA